MPHIPGVILIYIYIGRIRYDGDWNCYPIKYDVNPVASSLASSTSICSCSGSLWSDMVAEWTMPTPRARVSDDQVWERCPLSILSVSHLPARKILGHGDKWFNHGLKSNPNNHENSWKNHENSWKNHENLWKFKIWTSKKIMKILKILSFGIFCPNSAVFCPNSGIFCPNFSWNFLVVDKFQPDFFMNSGL